MKQQLYLKAVIQHASGLPVDCQAEHLQVHLSQQNNQGISRHTLDLKRGIIRDT